MASALPKLAQADLATVVERATLPPEAEVPLRGCTDIEAALDRLEAAGFVLEAVRVLAHALPKREAFGGPACVRPPPHPAIWPNRINWPSKTRSNGSDVRPTIS